MDFAEAEGRFRWLEQQRRIHRLSMEEYRKALNELRVTDAQGRLWMLQELTGYWHVWDGAQWQLADPRRMAPAPAQPPQRQAPPPQPQYAPQPQPAPQPQYAPQPQMHKPAPASGGGCAKIALYVVLWGVIWTVIAVAVYVIWGREEPMVLAGVGLAALISLIAMFFILMSNWEGVIVELKSERVRVNDSDDDWHYENQLFAYIRQPNGKTRKQRAMKDWQVGDRLVKRRGEASIKKVG